jgi:hypothetical protein
MTKSVKRVWLNQWFSTAYHIVNLLRDDTFFAFYCVGTSRNIHSPVSLACDEWYAEEEYQDDQAYLSFCLDFCKIHAVDIFIPRRGMKIISHNLDLFSGTCVMIERDAALFDLCCDKLACYAYVKTFLPGCVPEYAVPENAGEFHRAYIEMSARYPAVCYKASRDEGAVTYRKFRKNEIDALKDIPHSAEAYMDALFGEAASRAQEPIIVMPHLDGEEVSVDALKTRQGFILLPRFKPGGRHEYMKYDAEILSLCEAILERISLSMPCNIQFKYHDGRPYLLEINTRMSGGVQLTALASGINIPNIACNKLLGVEKKWHLEKREVSLSYIETPLVLRGSI